jgi:hypothetical protein
MDLKTNLINNSIICLLIDSLRTIEHCELGTFKPRTREGGRHHETRVSWSYMNNNLRT